MTHIRGETGDGDDHTERGAHDGGAPICACGVTAIPAETTSADQPTFVCENPDCEAYGTIIG